MLEKYIGQYCPHCGIPFTENDTLAVCDKCGTVLHLACRQSLPGCVIPGCPGGIGEILGGAPAAAPAPESDTIEHIPAPVFAQVVTEDVAARPTVFQNSLTEEVPPVEPTPEPAAPVFAAEPAPAYPEAPAPAYTDAPAPAPEAPAPAYTEAPAPAPETPAPKKKKKRVGLTITLILVALLLIGGAVAYIFLGIPYFKYQDAVTALNSNNFENAYRLFSEAGDFGDAPQRMLETRYRQGQYLLDQKEFDRAYSIFQELGAYLDSPLMLNETRYRQGNDLYQQATKPEAEDAAAKFEEAYKIFEALGKYRDSADKLTNIRYQQAVAAMNEGDYAKAEELFTQLADYQDSAVQAKEARYQHALALLEEGKHAEALELLETISTYKDADDQILACKYAYVKANFVNTDETTYEYLQLLVDEDYEDAAELYKELYAWSAVITATNCYEDKPDEHMSSISKYDPVYVHFVLEGGAPDETADIVIRGTRVDGTPIEFHFNEGVEAGDPQWFGWPDGVWVNPDTGYGGTIRVDICQVLENDEEIVLISTNITISNY